MAIQLECISLIIPIEVIDRKYPGGWDRFYDDADLGVGGGRMRHDRELFRDGAMSPMDMAMMVSQWEEMGFQATGMVDGKLQWIDMCVMGYSVPVHPACPWLKLDERNGMVSYVGGRARQPLIQPLFEGPLDIVGDIHGEFDALMRLIDRLGYDQHASHREGRRLVFAGDLCDRGPDSPAVIAQVGNWVRAGRAQAVLGNHEINLLADDAKDGSGWFFQSRIESDSHRYEFDQCAWGGPERDRIRRFLDNLPVALERDDLRVVHAAWVPEKIAAIRRLRLGNAGRKWKRYEAESRKVIKDKRLAARVSQEASDWGHSLEDPEHRPPVLPAHAEKDALEAMYNPIKVLLSGVERPAETPFFAGNKWRFMDRVKWWDEYEDGIPVIVGHYWRGCEGVAAHSGGPDIFDGVPSYAWHGKRGNVFCVDYSVGGRWKSRKPGGPSPGDFRLAAMRWPERELVFDDGERMPTAGFGGE